MVKHIVMFKFQNELPIETRESAQKMFKEGIEKLPSVIPFIKEVYVGFNCNTSEKWDICLYSVFNNLQDVKSYSIHPAHKAVAIELMKYIEERACVDFEI